MIFLAMIDTDEGKRKFVILYEKYRQTMEKVAYDVLGDHFLAEDAVHDAFIKVALNVDKIGNVDSRETKRFLVVITRNQSIDIYRKRGIQREREVSMDRMDEGAIEDVRSGNLSVGMEMDVDNNILNVLKNLPDKYRDVFLLKYSGGFGNREIARALDISEENVRQRLVRGKAIVQEAIS